MSEYAESINKELVLIYIESIVVNQKDREQLYLDVMQRVKNEPRYRKLDMRTKIDFIQSTSKIFQYIPESDLSSLTGEFLLENLNERGFRRCAKLIKFGDQLEKKIKMADPKWSENFKDKIRGISL